ncbi:MAG: hypothetical protein ACRDRU_05605, partial [Pseudonocardiaceae bacterium]
GLQMRPAIDIPRTNAASLEHTKLVEMIAKANGAQVHELGAMWNKLANEIVGFGESLHRTAASSESIWVGQAATEARTRLSELVTWCQQIGRGMQHMGTRVMRIQAEAAEAVQRSMPAPVPFDPVGYQNQLNSTSDPSEWARIQQDAQAQSARSNAAHDEAVRVIETYSASLLSTNGIMPAFTLPPEFGNRDTPPASSVLAPHGNGAGVDGGAGGSLSGGGSPQIAPGSGGSGPGGASPDFGVSSSGPDVSRPPGLGSGSPVLGGGDPGSGGQLSDSVAPAATLGQVASDLPGVGVPAGDGGGTGVPGFPPTTAGAGAGGRGSSGGVGSRFGPRGSSAVNALGRDWFGSTGGTESSTWADRGISEVAGRTPGASPGMGAFSPMVGGARGPNAEDTEHQRPSYLVETEDVWGDGRRVAPPVIGEDPPEYYH